LCIDKALLRIADNHTTVTDVILAATQRQLGNDRITTKDMAAPPIATDEPTISTRLINAAQQQE
jgi:hypothetical protein